MGRRWAAGDVVGIDLGERRIGVSISDSKRVLATPHSLITRAGDAEADRRAIAAVVSEVGAGLVVIGLPLTLAGEEGPAAAAAAAEASTLARELAIPVVLHDERLTTVEASRRRRMQPAPDPVGARGGWECRRRWGCGRGRGGRSRARRPGPSSAAARACRVPIDAVAATVLLQALAGRATGHVMSRFAGMPEGTRPMAAWPTLLDLGLAGVVGFPVRQSLSPVLHNVVFGVMGLDWGYVAFEVPPGHRAGGRRRRCGVARLAWNVGLRCRTRTPPPGLRAGGPPGAPAGGRGRAGFPGRGGVCGDSDGDGCSTISGRVPVSTWPGGDVAVTRRRRSGPGRGLRPWRRPAPSRSSSSTGP